jgi:aldose sugar dehydrogenase
MIYIPIFPHPTRLFTFFFLALLVVGFSFDPASASKSEDEVEPTVNETDLKIEMVSQMDFAEERNGLSPVTSMAFLGQNDILLLEKNNGLVHRVTNGELLEEPLLDVEVANERERGLLGVAVAKNESSKSTYVFLHFTESAGEDGEDDCPRPDFICKPGADPLGNRLYRYELANNKLVSPRLMLNLPASPGPVHNGGAISIGPDGNIYMITGDLISVDDLPFDSSLYDKAQNNENATTVDGRSGILRVSQDGRPVQEGVLGNEHPLNFYYAYGIRNGFGIDFDPVTGNLWDTENGGVFRGDEINLVEPGFNSGWIKVDGLWKPKTPEALVIPTPFKSVDFNGRGKYRSPELTLNFTVGLTALVFLDSTVLGKGYENDLFAADHNNGRIYHFDLSSNRKSLELNDVLDDKIANSTRELRDVEFASGFGAITDLEIGPDGYLYVLSHTERKATISKIVPTNRGSL